MKKSQHKSASSNTIFKAGSTTYYWSSIFFPPTQRAEVADLYAFVRTADDFVDAIPAQEQEFYAYKQETLAALAGTTPTHPQIQALMQLVGKHSFDTSWIQDFLNAMESDLNHKPYRTYEQLHNYMYGSAAVVGLMMCAILGISSEGHAAAVKQGEAMQLINFIRDVAEDNELDRQYLPSVELKKFGLADLTQHTAEQHASQFRAFMRAQIEYYHELQASATDGYGHIPYRYRVPIATAATLYGWTARTIAHNPHIVFERKVKPSKTRVIATALWCSIRYARC